ncbi:MAG: Bacterial sugar transferase, partial [Actinomycetota bacterium]|nr:Bacterial sugar transferase [Actinomycetota bacterium]
MGLGSIDRDVQNSAAAAVPRASTIVDAHQLIVSPHATEGATALAHSETQSTVQPIAEARPIFRLSAPPLTDTRQVTLYERSLKPVIDKALAFVLLIVLAPVLGVVGVMVAKSLGRPIVLRQRRVGKNGERFV